MKKKSTLLLLFLACCGICVAQQVASSGGYSVKSDVSVNWVLGGDVSALPVNTPGISAKLQKEFGESGISVKVYPSPAIDLIYIEINPADMGRLILDLFNDSGTKVLSQEVVHQPLIQVNISDISPGIYFLKILSAESEEPFRIEKIVKIQNQAL